MARNSFSSGQNQHLRPHHNSTRGIVNTKKGYQNLILTTRIVRNECLGVFGPKNAQTLTSDYSSGQNQILRPLFSSNHILSTIKIGFKF